MLTSSYAARPLQIVTTDFVVLSIGGDVYAYINVSTELSIFGCYTYFVRGYCVIDLPLPHTVLVVFERLTEKHLPDLYVLLKHKLQILTMVSLSWFLTIFLTVMDSEVAVNILDCFFIDGAKVSINYRL